MKYVKPFYENESVVTVDVVLASVVQVKYYETDEGKKAEINVDYANLFGKK